MNSIYELIIFIYSKVGKFAEEHRTAFDISVGGGIGFVPTIVKYWEHFTSQENQFHFWDGIVNTAGNTITGAILLWVLHTFVLKKKVKEEKTKK